MEALSKPHKNKPCNPSRFKRPHTTDHCTCSEWSLETHELVIAHTIKSSKALMSRSWWVPTYPAINSFSNLMYTQACAVSHRCQWQRKGKPPSSKQLPTFQDCGGKEGCCVMDTLASTHNRCSSSDRVLKLSLHLHQQIFARKWTDLEHTGRERSGATRKKGRSKFTKIFDAQTQTQTDRQTDTHTHAHAHPPNPPHIHLSIHTNKHT